MNKPGPTRTDVRTLREWIDGHGEDDPSTLWRLVTEAQRHLCDVHGHTPPQQGYGYCLWCKTLIPKETP